MNRKSLHTILPARLSTTIAAKQILGVPSQNSSDLSLHISNSWNHHVVVGGRLMAHPGSLGQLIGDSYFSQDEQGAAEKPTVRMGADGEPEEPDSITLASR